MLETLTRESVQIDGPRGRLAGELVYAAERPVATCLLVNPHPHMGGRMGNPLITRLAEALPAAGALVLRFDYAGVGDSEGGDIDVYASMRDFWATGTTPEDAMMIEDARAAARWLCAQLAEPLILIGYSFGAYAAAQLIGPQTQGLILISPTIERHDFSPVIESLVPKLIIHGHDDFATPSAATEEWAAMLPAVWRVCGLAEGDHFFRGQEDRVASLCAMFVTDLTGGGL